MQFSLLGEVVARVLPQERVVLLAPENAADAAVTNAHGQHRHHVRQEEVNYVISVIQFSI